MQINIKTSETNQKVVSELTKKLPNGTKENVIARIALGFSIKSGKKFNLQTDYNLYDSKGKEYKEHILFDAKYRNFFIALICQHYGIYKTDDNIPKYIKLHIDHGLESIYNIFSNQNNYDFFDFLMDSLESGISFLENKQVDLGAVKNHNQNIEKSYFSEPIKILVGNDSNNENDIYLTFNDTSLYSNNHIAVSGKSGSGKTQFALHILKEISEKSNHQVNFIYLDFKGLKGNDLQRMDYFFQQTKAQFIDVSQQPFPINPLSFIDNINENNKKAGIDKFVDIIGRYSNLGVKQKGELREATTEVFSTKNADRYPNLKEINDKLLEIVGEKRDSLTEIIGELTRYNIFEDNKNEIFLNQNLYLSLPDDLPASVRFTSLFLIINYIYNTFMNMEDSPVENNSRAMRYILLIDEAHTIFKERKYLPLLDDILRKIRSKGVSVMLLSQGISEFNQKEFDFSSLCEISFLLNINDKNNTKAVNKFLSLSEKDGSKTFRSLENIEKGQAVSNIKEFIKGELFNIKQFYSN